MKELIDKSALVAEIERKKIPFKKDIDDGVYPTYLCALMDFEEFINTLEVKEVDLEKEIHLWMEDNTCGGYCSANIRETAEHFFELGLKAQKGE